MSDSHPLVAQLERVERVRLARRRREPFRDERVTLSHGSGGKASCALVEGLILPSLGAQARSIDRDSAILSMTGVAAARLAFTTDSYVVSPLFFPGADIGSLAVHGTINDLAMVGARPLAISLALIVEEGLDMAVLRRVLDSIGEATKAAGAPVVTGDTKVVQRGKADQLFITTTGVGLVDAGLELAAVNARPGDRVLLNGPIGDHGVAVLLAREALDIEADISSDSAPLHHLVERILAVAPRTRALKDPTRGGVASSLNEIARAAGVAIAIDEATVPVRGPVRAVCEMLGLDPLHIANEGKLLAIVPPDQADAALAAMRASELGRDAAIIGEVLPGPADIVVVRTEAGGSRVLDMLVGDPLPRIC